MRQLPYPSLQQILCGGHLFTCFQPLVSIKKKSVFAYEALSRGTYPGNDSVIPPNILFSMPKTHARRVELDRACRQKALESFARFCPCKKDTLLSLNIDASIIDQSTVGSGVLMGVVMESGVNPGNVIIEIIESGVEDTEALITFANTYREYGFMIALDDVGAGHSNLDRIPLIKPDIIKIDRSLIDRIDQIYHKQEITKSLVNLSHKLGTLVVAEGVEREEEILALLEMGVDIFQGFYFAKPDRFDTGNSNGRNNLALAAKIERIAQDFKEHQIAKINARKVRHSIYNIVTDNIIEDLSRATDPGFNITLASVMGMHPDLECLYVLDSDGLQISDTICNLSKLKTAKRYIYQPATKGTDHSLKDYFLPIRAGLTRYTTETYISLASGNRCQTIAAQFHAKNGHDYILCLDITRAD